MISSPTRTLRTGVPWQRQLLAPAALAAVVLLSSCSGASNNAATTAAPPTSAAASTTPAASATATASATAGATPTAVTAVKELVDGFPTKLIPLMTGADVQASSLQRSTPLSVASLTATVTAKSADVLAYYTKVFTGQGFTAQPGDSVEGVPLKTFVRAAGQEVVTVSVVQTGSTATVTIGANVLPASLK